VELTTSGGAVIHVKLGHGVDPYLEILIPGSIKGGEEMVLPKKMMIPPLSVFTGGHTVPLPSRGEGQLGRTLATDQPCVSTFSSYGRRG
jgi:hypothetical protein